MIDAVPLSPVPYPHGSRIVVLGDHTACCAFSLTLSSNFLNDQASSRSFEQLAAYRETTTTMTRSGEAISLSAQLVTSNFFSIFEVTALLRRTLQPGRDGDGKPLAAVLSYEAWSGLFGSDPSLASAARSFATADALVALG